MNTKNLIVLALVGVVVLTGALIVSTSGSSEEGSDATRVQSSVPTPGAVEGTVSGAAAQTSVEVQADNVKTSVNVQ